MKKIFICLLSLFLVMGCQKEERKEVIYENRIDLSSLQNLYLELSKGDLNQQEMERIFKERHLEYLITDDGGLVLSEESYWMKESLTIHFDDHKLNEITYLSDTGDLTQYNLTAWNSPADNTVGLYIEKNTSMEIVFEGEEIETIEEQMDLLKAFRKSISSFECDVEYDGQVINYIRLVDPAHFYLTMTINRIENNTLFLDLNYTNMTDQSLSYLDSIMMIGMQSNQSKVEEIFDEANWVNATTSFTDYQHGFKLHDLENELYIAMYKRETEELLNIIVVDVQNLKISVL